VEPARAHDPAVELREKLAETRTGEASPAASPGLTAEESMPPADPASLDEPSSLDARRARVHERAQEAIELMRGPDDADGPGEPGGAA
jgi:hypothetical protein